MENGLEKTYSQNAITHLLECKTSFNACNHNGTIKADRKIVPVNSGENCYESVNN